MKRKTVIRLILGLILGLSIACASITNTSQISETQDVRIVVISDLNSQYGSTEYEPEIDKAIALLPQWQPDLVLCGGGYDCRTKKESY